MQKGKGQEKTEGKEKKLEEEGWGHGHRYWSVGRHRAQCAVVQSDCPEKNFEWFFKTAS